MTETSFISRLSPIQKISGLAFIFTKITSTATIPLIFASAASPSFLSLSKWMIGVACFFLGVCITTCILSMKQTKESKIEEIMNNPEMKKLIEERMKKQC